MFYKFPEKFISRYQTIIPDFDKFLAVLQTPLKQCLRINTLKATKEEVLKLLSDIKLEPIPWCDYGFRLKDKVNIGERKEYQQGLIYGQEAISMLPAIILDPKPNEKILDMCAAPGSKTTQIAQIMKNTGQIVANEVSKTRIRALKSNLARLGITNTVISHKPGQKIGYLMPNHFDRVLVDAPCSLEGMFRNTPKALSDWKVSKIKRLAQLQKGLINSAFKALKPNGVLVYSTCTFAPEENEAVVDYLFKKYPNITCEPITVPNLKARSGVLEWGRAKFNRQIENTIRIYPHDNDTEGFYIAQIRKTTS